MISHAGRSRNVDQIRLPRPLTDHRGRYALSAGGIDGNPEALTDSERESADVVLENLGYHTEHQLSEASHHKDGPWYMARDRAGARELQRSNEELRSEEIADYFGALTAAAE
ncbi:hypothetical protein ACIQOW_36945 [Kitasatospora sp. NPDC091335]|uniref:hypothetical protein n=1 Tax=Kitasatospora sp. NPDC091335 TaxID=3364085 RepID=UPI00382EE05E